MSELAHLFASHLLLGWLAIGAVFLIVELLTGSGWLLWPAGSAAVVGLVSLGVHMTWAGQCAAFAVLTIISTFVGRRYLVGRAHVVGDVNDTRARLIGHAGRAVDAFVNGQGRVFVDGKEWSAEAEGEAAIEAGAAVEVVALVTGARLRVKAG